jgi:hypothetical protein
VVFSGKRFRHPPRRVQVVVNNLSIERGKVIFGTYNRSRKAACAVLLDMRKWGRICVRFGNVIVWCLANTIASEAMLVR